MIVSILMCTYNGSKFINEQLESIYNQSLKPDEVVIIDDCSSDNTINLIENFIKDRKLNNCWKITSNKENKGWRSNFREGISHVSGDLLFFSDQDDIWDKDKLLKMVEIFQTNEKINVLSSEEALLKDGSLKNKGLNDGKIERVEMNEKGDNFQIRCPGCAMGIRTQYIREIIDFFTPVWAHDDFFWKFSALDGSGALWHRVTVNRRIHGGNASIVKHRNRDERINLIERDIIKFNGLKDYCVTQIRRSTDAKRLERLKGIDTYLEKYINGNKVRADYLKTRSLRLLFELLTNYRMIYYSPKVLIGDLIF